MGRIVFQCYPPDSEVPMASALARRPFPLIPLALLAACNTETSNERVLGIQAMSFANSEWSEPRSEEHTSELQSQSNLVCRLLLEKKKHRLSSSPGSTGSLVESAGRVFSHTVVIDTACTR